MYKIIGADGNEYGPIAAEVLRQWIAEGRADAQTRVLPEGAAEWKVLGALPEFAPLVAAGAGPRTAPAAMPAVLGPKNNPLAVWGMVMGILALTCGICCYGMPFNILGIVFSLLGLSQIKQDPGSQQGRGMAIAGLALSIASIVLSLLLVIFGVATSRFFENMRRFSNW
jgi:hypothetical protein